MGRLHKEHPDFCFTDTSTQAAKVSFQWVSASVQNIPSLGFQPRTKPLPHEGSFQCLPRLFFPLWVLLDISCHVISHCVAFVSFHMVAGVGSSFL